MKLNLMGSNEKGLSVNINNQESQNCYVMASPRGRNGVVLVGSPGTALFSTVSGEVRGAIEMGGAAYFVIGTALYSVNGSGTATSLGTVAGSGRVSLAHDGTNIICVNGTTTGYYYSVSGGLSTVTLPYVAYTVAVLDTYAVFTSDDDLFFISAVGDTDSLDGLDFSRAQISSDDLLAVAADHGEALMFGKKTIEPWSNTGNVDFAFELNKGSVIERGLYARHAWAKDDNSIIFLGDDLIIYRLEGYSPVRVSDDSTEIQLSSITNTTDLNNAFAFFYTDHGHKFFQLTIPNQVTLVLDLATREWHKKKHVDLNTHHATAYVKAYGKHLIGGINGNVYEMSRSYYKDADKVLKRLRRTHTYSLEDKLIRWKKVKIEMEFGTTSYLTGYDSDPPLIMRFSRDDGRTWGNEKRLTLGKIGEYTAKAVKRNCGSDRRRVIEFYMTADAPFYVVDAYASFA